MCLMAFSERPYQAALDAAIQDAWRQGARDVLAVLPTGGGKTVVFSNIIAREQGASVAIAHRQELTGQMSLALARNGVRHRVIGPKTVQGACVALHMLELGRHFVDPTARAAVAGIDTLVRMDPKDPWLAQVQLAVTDEGHHVLRDNKWGRGLLMFPNARGLGVTATALRADGKGLGRHADGIMDCMVQGPGMRELINAGYLTPYRIFAPPSDLHLTDDDIGSGGDFKVEARTKAVKRSNITGHVVEHYLRIASGKLAVCFANDIEHATTLTANFRAEGVAAELVTSHTPDAMRAQIMRRFRAREVTVLVNVDLFGEGFDLPAVEVVIMARPTASWGLYCQQFGRMLRILEGKLWGILIDHVGNVERFARTRGLPDTPQTYTLDRRERAEKGKPSDAVPVRTCLNPTCLAVYERVLDCCPFCATEPVPAGRRSPAEVDGVLHELDPEVLRMLRKESDAVMGPAPMQGAGQAIAKSAFRNHNARAEVQNKLRAAIALWGGWQEDHLGRSRSEAQRRFFFKFGVDGLTASAWGPEEAARLEAYIRADLAANNVTEINS
jgi:DNA repair protein RadD